MQAGRLRVEVVYSRGPRDVLVAALELPPGATARQAALAACWDGVPAALQAGTLTLAIWGRGAAADAALSDGDRVELLRPLQVDPKEARRRRHQAQQQREGAAPPRRRTPAG